MKIFRIMPSIRNLRLGVPEVVCLGEPGDDTGLIGGDEVDATIMIINHDVAHPRNFPHLSSHGTHPRKTKLGIFTTEHDYTSPNTKDRMRIERPTITLRFTDRQWAMLHPKPKREVA